MADTVSLRLTGPSSTRIDIAFVAEGYTAAERSQFLTDAGNALNYFIAAANKTLSDPFYSYRSLINATATFVASQQSGYDINGTAVNTAFDAEAHLSDNRLVYGDESKVRAAISDLTGTGGADIILVLVNSANYGGAGGGVAWSTARNSSSYEIALHEIGHSFAGLHDEYVDSAIADSFPLSAITNSVHVSTSSNPSLVNWSEWVGYTDGLGTIGVFQGGYYRATGVWRATFDSKMNHLGVAFSAPQKEAFINRFFDLVGDFLDLSSPAPLRFVASTPDNALFRFNWSVNGELQQTGGSASFALDNYIRAQPDGDRSYNLTLAATDGTGNLREAAVIANATEQESRSFTFSKVTLDAAANVRSFAASKAYFVLAGDGNDAVSISGTGVFADYLDGGAGNDAMTGGGGNDTLDGGSGIDTAIFVGARASATIASGASGVTLTDSVAGRNGVDTLVNVERIKFDNGTLALDIALPALGAGNAGSAYRLYEAAFNRTPDNAGLAFWIKQLDSGVSVRNVAAGFVTSDEFRTAYGANPTATQLIDAFYQNILGRAPEQAGFDYWFGILNGRPELRSSVLEGISNSQENQNGLIGVIGQGIFLPDNLLA